MQRKQPRRGQSSNADAMQQRPSVLESLLRLIRPPHVFHMDSKEQRNQLIDLLWTGEYMQAVGRFTAANPDLVNLLDQQTEVDWSDQDAPLNGRRLRPLQSQWPRFEGVLSDGADPACVPAPVPRLHRHPAPASWPRADEGEPT